MTIILFGSTGMLGKYIFNVLKTDYKVITIDRKEYDVVSDDFEKLEKIIDQYDYDLIINCVGAIPQKYSTDKIREYILINTIFPLKLSNLVSLKNKKFIHITTDCVFDGKKGNYKENDEHTCSEIYGVTKSLGELYKNATIIRTSIIGEENTSKVSLLEWVISNKNKTINGYNDHYWNGVTCFTLSKIIKEIITKGLYWNGIRHIFSPKTYTKYELCEIIDKIYKLNLTIIPVNTGPINKSLSSIYQPIFKIDDIYKQIEDQKKYNDTYRLK